MSGATARVPQVRKLVSFMATLSHVGTAFAMAAGPDKSAIASAINFWEFGRTE